MIRRAAEWVRFLEMAESTVHLARLLGDKWADGAPSITSNALEFDERGKVIAKHQVTYQYLGHGRCYLSVNGAPPMRVSSDTEGLELEYSESQRMLAITSARPLFDRLCNTRMKLLIRADRQGIATYPMISASEGVFNRLLEAYL